MEWMYQLIFDPNEPKDLYKEVSIINRVIDDFSFLITMLKNDYSNSIINSSLIIPNYQQQVYPSKNFIITKDNSSFHINLDLLSFFFNRNNY